MKRTMKWSVVALSILWSVTTFANTGREPQHSKHSINYKNKSVNYVKIKLDECVNVDVVTANDAINTDSPLKEMNDKKQGFAAINGTYFDAYNGDMPLPYGTVIKDGELIHKTTVGATIGFTEDNRVLMDYVKIYISGTLDDKENYWYAWNVNRPTTANDGVIIYTDDYQGNIHMPAGSVGVVTQGNKILKHITQPQTVPQNGFIVVYYPEVSQHAYKLAVGSSISYEAQYSTNYTASEDWEDVVMAISAGPSMILEGQVTNQPKKEGFTEAKIVENAATRSFIGFREPDMLVIGTVGSATIDDMVGIAQMMGLKSAMCLDGGGSSALMYNQVYVSGPGRDLNNALVFSKATVEEQLIKKEASKEALIEEQEKEAVETMNNDGTD